MSFTLEPCGPDCTCFDDCFEDAAAEQPDGAGPLSEHSVAYGAIDDLERSIDVSLELAYERGYAEGLRDGARDALYLSKALTPEPTLESLAAELADLKEKVEVWAPGVDDDLEDLAMYVHFTSELVTDILEAHDEALEALEADQTNDAVYLEAVADRVSGVESILEGFKNDVYEAFGR